MGRASIQPSLNTTRSPPTPASPRCLSPSLSLSLSRHAPPSACPPSTHLFHRSTAPHSGRPFKRCSGGRHRAQWGLHRVRIDRQHGPDLGLRIGYVCTYAGVCTWPSRCLISYLGMGREGASERGSQALAVPGGRWVVAGLSYRGGVSGGVRVCVSVCVCVWAPGRRWAWSAPRSNHRRTLPPPPQPLRPRGVCPRPCPCSYTPPSTCPPGEGGYLRNLNREGGVPNQFQ